MGAMQNNNQKVGKTNSKRGSVKNDNRLAAFAAARGNEIAGWGECSSDKLQGVILGITALGGAVTFGLSRNRGSHFIALMLDDSRETLWFNGDVNLDDALDTVMGTLEAME
jgi:hypothetical protein